MGAASFFTYGFGETAKQAFQAAQEHAEYMHGHGGYTGTIAEKHGFTVIPKSEHKGKQKRKYAGQLLTARDERVDDKWGPAGAINVSGTKEAKNYRARKGLEGKHGDVWLFFGMASC
ncbi:hypothetical protein ACFR9U_16155 [Halorientalis brevis]|uniref:Uncharacterized protein n=1 Tax=Halorientalis brevis TaxID=1126241 RepID=A0ABD6CDZ7_9EURY|nr:hypothetical protein [Halorientalis brevis]